MTQAGAIVRWRSAIAVGLFAAVVGVSSPAHGDEPITSPTDTVVEPSDDHTVAPPAPDTGEPPTTEPVETDEPPVVAVGLPPVPPVVDEPPVVAVGLPPVPPVVDEPPVVAVGLPPVPTLAALASTVGAALRLIDDCL